MLARKTKRGECKDKTKNNNQQAHKILEIFLKVREGKEGQIRGERSRELHMVDLSKVVLIHL